MTLWIRLLTWSRLPLAAAVAITWTFGHFELGAWFFAVGLLTKAADTPLSVWRKCPIPADDELYRMVAVVFNATAALSLTWGFCIYDDKIPKVLAVLPILPLIVMTVLMVLTWVFIKPHSLLAKARSGLVSFIIILFTASFTPWLSFVSLGLIWAGEGYKLLYYADQTATPTKKEEKE